MTFKTAVKLYNKTGKYFFTKETMRAWGTILYPNSFKNDYFITAEDNFDRTCKKFTIRKFVKDYTDVETVSEFLQYETYDDALYALLKIVEEERNG